MLVLIEPMKFQQSKASSLFCNRKTNKPFACKKKKQQQQNEEFSETMWGTFQHIALYKQITIQHLKETEEMSEGV